MQAITVPLMNWERHFAASAIGPGCPEPLGQCGPRGRTDGTGSLAYTRIGFPRMVWRDVIRPRRRFWTGLAAVWAVILAGNFSLHDHSQTRAVSRIFTDIAGNSRIVQRPAKNSNRVVDGSFRAARCGTAKILSTGTPNGKHDDIDCLNLS